ncbi:hypothetical protein J7K74_01200 [Candidatus Woesearchaeota archaeon]|nr:hypothetical protein [Candidatus Woesearchaeota archaeon]
MIPIIDPYRSWTKKDNGLYLPDLLDETDSSDKYIDSNKKKRTLRKIINTALTLGIIGLGTLGSVPKAYANDNQKLEKPEVGQLDQATKFMHLKPTDAREYDVWKQINREVGNNKSKGLELFRSRVQNPVELQEQGYKIIIGQYTYLDQENSKRIRDIKIITPSGDTLSGYVEGDKESLRKIYLPDLLNEPYNLFHGEEVINGKRIPIYENPVEAIRKIINARIAKDNLYKIDKRLSNLENALSILEENNNEDYKNLRGEINNLRRNIEKIKQLCERHNDRLIELEGLIMTTTQTILPKIDSLETLLEKYTGSITDMGQALSKQGKDIEDIKSMIKEMQKSRKRLEDIISLISNSEARRIFGREVYGGIIIPIYNLSGEENGAYGWTDFAPVAQDVIKAELNNAHFTLQIIGNYLKSRGDKIERDEGSLESRFGWSPINLKLVGQSIRPLILFGGCYTIGEEHQEFVNRYIGLEQFNDIKDYEKIVESGLGLRIIYNGGEFRIEKRKGKGVLTRYPTTKSFVDEVLVNNEGDRQDYVIDTDYLQARGIYNFGRPGVRDIENIGIEIGAVYGTENAKPLSNNYKLAVKGESNYRVMGLELNPRIELSNGVLIIPTFSWKSRNALNNTSARQEYWKVGLMGGYKF